MIMMPIMMIITVVMMAMMIMFVITLLIDCGRVTDTISHPLNSFRVEFSFWRRKGGALTPDLFQTERILGLCGRSGGFLKIRF